MDEASHAALKYADETIHAPDYAVLAETGVEVRAVVMNKNVPCFSQSTSLIACATWWQ